MATRARTGKKVREFSDEEIIQAVKHSHGLVVQAARVVGCTPDTIYDHINKNPVVRKAVKDAREEMKDYAEGKLYLAIQQGNVHATVFYLETQAKDRGYSRRQELTGKDGRPLTPDEEKKKTDFTKFVESELKGILKLQANGPAKP